MSFESNAEERHAELMERLEYLAKANREAVYQVRDILEITHNAFNQIRLDVRLIADIMLEAKKQGE